MVAQGNRLLGIDSPPGGRAQREALKAWVLEKLGAEEMPGILYGPEGQTERVVDGWLDELPWDSRIEDAEKKLQDL